MKDSSFEQIIKNGVLVLEDVFPKLKYLYFPLLYNTLFWMLRRPGEWEKKIFSWKVWSDPGRIKIKPDEFILFFFDLNEDLSRQYRIEVEKKDMRVLRKAFICLYPVVGLSDPFLTALFFDELNNHDFRCIVSEFSGRVSKAAHDIDTAKGRSRLVAGFSLFFENLASLSASHLKQYSSRKAIAELVKKYTAKEND